MRQATTISITIVAAALPIYLRTYEPSTHADIWAEAQKISLMVGVAESN